MVLCLVCAAYFERLSFEKGKISTDRPHAARDCLFESTRDILEILSSPRVGSLLDDDMTENP